MKIGFIGAGNMGGAILRGLVSGGFRGGDILVYDRDSARLMQLLRTAELLFRLRPRRLQNRPIP